MRREFTLEQHHQLALERITRAAKKSKLSKKDFVAHHYSGTYLTTKLEIEKIYDEWNPS